MSRAIVIFSAVLAVARAAVISSPGVTVVQPAAAVETSPYDSHPQYSYSYSVADGLTGDQKSQEESRNGDVVHGSYSLVEPDGSRRRVSYASDPINGFNAVVQRDPSIAIQSRPLAVAYRSVVGEPVQVVRQSAVASASANVQHSSSVASISPYVSHELVGVRAGALYANQPVHGTFSHGTAGLVRVQ